MRWITFAIFLYFFAALQVARFGALHPYTAPDHPLIEYLPLLGIFYALYADEDQAILAGFWCALLHDLLSAEPLGIYTIVLALVCYGVVRIRMSLFRGLWLSQFVVVFLAVSCFGVLAACLQGGLSWFLAKPPMGGPFWRSVAAMEANALYTGLVAPVIYWILFRFQGILRFHLKNNRNR